MRKLIRRLFIISILLFAVYILSGLPDSAQLPKAAKDTLRIATLNINYRNQSDDEIEAFIRQNELDVILIVEYTKWTTFPDLLKDKYTIACAYPANTHGLALLYRKDLDVSASIEPIPVKVVCNMPFVAATIGWNGKKFSLLGPHAPPPVPRCGFTTDKVLKAYSDLIQDGKLKRPVGKAENEKPLILLGDLNAFPVQSGISALKDAGMADAWTGNRWGTGLSWAPIKGLFALARIDYIMHGSAIEVETIYNTNLPGSDHNAIIADIRLR
ncbi:MAG: endonuclease/exonuclease/phosphatase family protein [Calditrichia bacterium]